MSTDVATGVPSLNDDWGALGERVACDRFDLAHCPDPRSATWYDAVTTVPVCTDPTPVLQRRYLLRPATPVEVKSTVFRQADGSSTRRGRFWIDQSNHRRLLEASGAYALNVYRPPPEAGEDDVDVEHVLATRIVPAFVVDRLVDSWTPCGLTHDVDECGRIAWNRLVPVAEVSR